MSEPKCVKETGSASIKCKATHKLPVDKDAACGDACVKPLAVDDDQAVSRGTATT